jgi:ectoine hydroxylase-related dioxygenase (phytanoyl-CoA dioxygenase family)
MTATTTAPSVSASQFASAPIAVPRQLSDAQVKSFVDDGFFIAPNLISSAELEELKAETVKIARGGYDTPSIPRVADSVSDREVLQSILCIHQPHFVSPVMLKYVKHAKICGMLSQLTGAHLAHWDGSVKCMQSMLFVKPPGFQGQAWHQDEIYIPTRDRSLIGAWIAMDDATIENGCLWVVPGSHRSGYLYPQRDHGNFDEFDRAPESWGFDESKEVPVEVKAGAVVYFNGYLLHRSRKNRSNIYRRVLVNHYMNAWSHLPWYMPAEGARPSPALLDVRVVEPVAGVDPYAWKGYTAPKKDVHLRKCKANDPEVAARVAQEQRQREEAERAGRGA